MRIIRSILIIVIIILGIGIPVFAEVEDNQGLIAEKAANLMVQMDDFLRCGNFRDAISTGVEAEKLFTELDLKRAQMDVLIKLSRAYDSLGHYRIAQNCLDRALHISKNTEHGEKNGLILNNLGNSYLLTNRLDEAYKVFQEAFGIAKENKDDALLAAIYNNIGNFYFLQNKYKESIGEYEKSYTLALKAGSNQLAARTLSNWARACLARNDTRQTSSLLQSSRERHLVLPDSHDKAYGLIGIGRMYRTLALRIPRQKHELENEARKTLDDALKSAANIHDGTSISYAAGYLGESYEDEGSYEKSLAYTRHAILEAQAAGALESLYRWYWQTARVMNRTGNVDEALRAYRKTVNILQAIRYEFSGDCRIYNQTTYSDAAEPIYLEFVNLLLKRAESMQSNERADPFFLEAIQTIELLRTAELQDYFHNTCVATKRIKIDRSDLVHPNRAIFYFITLPDRVEIIAGLPQGFRKHSVNIDRNKVANEIRKFRRMLENRTSREYLIHAGTIYDWIVRPFQAELAEQKVDTIIFIPDGTLRVMPFAALHDGNDFLIKRFAAVTMPGLTLVDASPPGKEKQEMLIAGLSDPVQGFSELPYVPYEVDTIQKYNENVTLMNKDFATQSMYDHMKKSHFSIVHIASHGEFSENAADTYILTWSEKLNMDQLEKFVGLSRYQKKPVELLTLSACQSAATNDRAALGLAGLSVKAGARSALATLWYINDQSSSDLVIEFYKNLTKKHVSKAKALQQAQIMLLDGDQYRHPCYWASFVLVGNWL